MEKFSKNLLKKKQFSKGRLAVLAKIKGHAELLGIPAIDSGEFQQLTLIEVLESTKK